MARTPPGKGMATRVGKKALARPVSTVGLTKSVEAAPRGGSMIAYFDESGSHQGAPVFGLACFVARERQWADFRNRWRRLLDQQAVPEIHMADLEA